MFALLVGFITYKGINWELKKQKEYFESSLIQLENKTTELQKIIIDYNNKHHYETGNLNMLISMHHKDDFVTAFMYSLRSANEFSKCGDENYDETLRALNTSNINLKKIQKAKMTESFFKKSDKILSELVKIPNPKITFTTAEIIVKINALKQSD